MASDLVIELKKKRDEALKNVQTPSNFPFQGGEFYWTGYLDAVEDCIEATRRDEQKQGFF